MLQCPQCGLAVDIPTMDDLPNLNPDGTFAFDDLSVLEDPITLADLHRTFTPRTTDEQGHEKDLRPTRDHFERIVVAETLAPQRVAPRYDPVTGELIRPLQLKDEEPVPVIPLGPDSRPVTDPIPATRPSPKFQHTQPMPVPSLAYAVGATRRPSHYPPWVDLLMPANMAVMFFVLLFYVAAYLAKIPLNTFAIYLNVPTVYALIPNIPLWLIVAHYGCVVEDIGPDAMDELPRPMRHMAFGEDLFHPLLRVLLALTLCFWPVGLVLLKMDQTTRAGPALVLTLVVIGCSVFPAVALTTLTGVTVLNLTPSRIMAVISLCGGRYLKAVPLFFAVFVLTSYLMLGPSTIPAMVNFPGIQYTLRLTVLLPGVVLAIYLSHLFAWQLGLMYREHFDEFPWLAQRHIRTEKPRS